MHRWWELAQVSVSHNFDDYTKGSTIPNEQDPNFLRHPLVPREEPFQPTYLARAYARLKAANPLGVPDAKTMAQELISYGIGCAFGRYETRVDGPILNSYGSRIQDFEAAVPHPQVIIDNANCAPIDSSNIIPVLEGVHFSDDVVTELTTWLAGVFGVSSLSSNIDWIEQSLGCSIRTYMRNQFYFNHVERFSGQPIYWLVASSASDNPAFMALIYAYRYDPSIIERLLTNYVRPYRLQLEAACHELRELRAPSAVEEAALALWQHEIAELITWEQNVLEPLAAKHPALDESGGVRKNYQKLEGLLLPLECVEQTTLAAMPWLALA